MKWYLIIVAIVALHVWALHVTGQGNPDGVEVKDVKKETVPFTPYATLKDGFGVACFLIFYAWFIFYVPNFLGHSDNYIEAQPLSTPQHIVPEWYYLPFYAILRAIPNKLLGVIALFGSIGILAFLPWLDTSRVRSARYRPLFKQFFWIFVLVAIGLGWLGSKPAEGGYVIAARVPTRVRASRRRQRLLEVGDDVGLVLEPDGEAQRRAVLQAVGRAERGGVFIPMSLSRQELADLTGTTIETCIRIMSRWGKEDILVTEKDGFIVRDRAALETISNS